MTAISLSGLFDLPGAEASRMTGTTISHYRILEKLGAGGMGEVYKAEDTALHRLVALKFLTPTGEDSASSAAPRARAYDPAALERFQREARAAAALNHPNICTIYEIGEHEGQLFIAMELIEGETLAAKLKAGALGAEEAAKIARQIAEGLEEAHEHNIVHRDLKPANVMLTPKGNAKILDFGLAKLTLPIDPEAATEEELLLSRVGVVRGTVPYMSPEQLRGDAVDARTDIYAFGALLYEMATGRRPFPGTQTTQLIAAILTVPPPAPSGLNSEVSTELEAVILKALAKDPAERYPSVRELLLDLPAPGVLVTRSRKKTGPARTGTLKTDRRGQPKRGAALLLFGGLAIAVLAGLLLLVIPGLKQRAPTNPGVTAGAQLPSREELAVMPFSVVGGGPDERAFSRGLAEALTAKLTQLSAGHSLQVVPVGDLVAQHVETAKDAARVFGVNLVLTGSLEKAGGLVRVTYELIDPMTDRQIRAQVLTLADSNPFGIEDQVVEGTAGMLGLPAASASGGPTAMKPHGTQAASAFQDYLQGLGYMQNYDSPENLDKAVAAFRSALQADSTYALAYAALGQAYWRKYLDTHDTAWVDRAQQSCSQAVTLDPKAPASHLCLGTLENGTGQYTKAVAEFKKVLVIEPTNTEAFGELGSAQTRLKRTDEAQATYRRAISLRPNYWAPYNWLGVLDWETGKTESAAEMFKKVIALAPGNHMGYYNLGAVNYMMGKWPEAEEMFKKSIAIHPSAAAYSDLGTVVFYQGHYEESAGYFKKAIQFTPKDPQLWGNLADAYKWSADDRAKAVPTYQKAAELCRQGLGVNPSSYDLLGGLAMYEAQSSNLKQAMRDLARALPLAPKDPVFMYNVALVYRLAGIRSQALSYLQRAVKLGYPVEALRADPEWSDMKSDPEFQELIVPAKRNH